jgi:hypothetical protein
LDEIQGFLKPPGRENQLLTHGLKSANASGREKRREKRKEKKREEKRREKRSPMSPRSGTPQSQYVLDANALVRFFEHRHGGASRVRSLFERALGDEQPLLKWAVRWGDVFHVEWRCRREAGASEAVGILPELPILVVPLDPAGATRAATIKQKHRIGLCHSKEAIESA